MADIIMGGAEWTPAGGNGARQWKDFGGRPPPLLRGPEDDGGKGEGGGEEEGLRVLAFHRAISRSVNPYRAYVGMEMEHKQKATREGKRLYKKEGEASRL